MQHTWFFSLAVALVCNRDRCLRERFEVFGARPIVSRLLFWWTPSDFVLIELVHRELDEGDVSSDATELEGNKISIRRRACVWTIFAIASFYRKFVCAEKLKSYLHNGTDKSLRRGRVGDRKKQQPEIQLSKCLNSSYVLHARFVPLVKQQHFE